MNLPQQTATYLGPITDTGRWENFRHRSDDIFICTPPKCGTTWTQAICAMLVFGKADHGYQVAELSPWIDAQFAPIDEYLAKIDIQPDRRFIKTHTPLDGIPYFESCTYLVVLRDPRDVFVSLCNHLDNMNDQDLAELLLPDRNSAFQYWLELDVPTGTWDGQCLKLVTDFLGTYWDYRDLPNVHLYHYSDMKRNLPDAISSMAEAVGVQLDANQLSDMSRAAGFEHMQANAEQFAPESGTGMWKTERGFFANGRSNQWKDSLSEADLQAFDNRLAELLPADQRHWLINGNGSTSS